MKLNVMTLSDLQNLRDDLSRAITAIEKLGKLNQDIIVDMTPGRPVQITCAWTMPEVGEPDAPGACDPVLVETSFAQEDVAAIFAVDIETSGQPVKVATPTEAAQPAPDAAPKSVAKGEEQPVEARPAPVVPAAGGTALVPEEQRKIGAYLDTLRMPRGWDLDLDLDLIEGIAGGQRLAEVTVDLGVDAQVCKDRYFALTATIRDQRNWIKIDGQTHLLAELRRRVRVSRGAAA